MRILKPEVAKEREEKILRLIIQEFVENRKPVGSELVAQKGLKGVSSATIRNTMKKLEDEGFLYQPHASGGRIPTDKAYRFYVDYLSKIQKIAIKERQRIEDEYKQNIGEINRLMAQTCKMLSALTHSAGFILQNSASNATLRRFDFIPLAPLEIMAILVTEDGNIKHWPIKVMERINPARLILINAFINDLVAGKSLLMAQRILWENINKGGYDSEGLTGLAYNILREVTQKESSSDQLYIEGVGQLLENVSPQDFSEFGQMVRVIEERDKFASFLNEKMQNLQNKETKNNISVSIGSENELSELKNLSIITSACKVGGKTIGLLGIVGPKHMEYTKMISLVNFIGEMLGSTLANWRLEIEDKEDK